MGTRSDTPRVPRWLDIAGHLMEQHRRFFVTLANVESFALANQRKETPVDRPIFICGLARAGSTILLNFLATHPNTASHRYRDFPFVHIPYWWNFFLEHAALKEVSSTERFHEDRIRVSPNSPEAMEEPVWVSFFPRCHEPTRSDILDGENRYPVFERFYRRHIQKVMIVRGGSRYLAKNNYNLSRIRYLTKVFPDAKIVIPVRDPISHVASSMRQHHIFSQKQRNDRRTRNYLRRAAHFEFGLDRRPVNVGDADAVHRIQHLWSEGHEPAGWAHYWRSVYAFVANCLGQDDGLREAALLVHYDDLCRRSIDTLSAIYEHCELQVTTAKLEQQANQLSAPSYYDNPFSKADEEEILRVTGGVHDRIRAMCYRPNGLE